MRSTHACTTLALVIVAAACSRSLPEDTGANESSTIDASESGQLGSTSHGSATETGNWPDGDECRQFETAMQCENKTGADGLPCEWRRFTPVRRMGSMCTVDDPVEMCVTLAGHTVAAGCGQAPGCEGTQYLEPAYKRLEDGRVLIANACGGSLPVDWQLCESGYADVDPPECACLCELASCELQSTEHDCVATKPSNEGHACQWADIRPVERIGDACAWGQARQACIEVDSVGAGCGVLEYPSCQDNVEPPTWYYRLGDGELELVAPGCGPVPMPQWQWVSCNGPVNQQPPECECPCLEP